MYLKAHIYFVFYKKGVFRYAFECEFEAKNHFLLWNQIDRYIRAMQHDGYELYRMEYEVRD